MENWEKKIQELPKEQQEIFYQLKESFNIISDNFLKLSEEKQEKFIDKIIPSVCNYSCNQKNCDKCLIEKLKNELTLLKNI